LFTFFHIFFQFSVLTKINRQPTIVAQKQSATPEKFGGQHPAMDVHRVCAKTAKIDFWAKELKTIDFRWMTLFRAPWASRYTFSIIACRT
jgi:hypothetical protein